jgi:hypothetical protein
VGDWWIDESPPVGPSEFDGWFIPPGSGLRAAVRNVSWSSEDSDPLGDIKEILARLRGKSIYFRPAAGGHLPASAGTHRGGGAVRIISGGMVHLYWIDECGVYHQGDPVNVQYGEKKDSKPEPEPEPNRDMGRINNTGPRRGSVFGRRGKKRY